MTQVKVWSCGIEAHFDRQCPSAFPSLSQSLAKLRFEEDFLGALRQVGNLRVKIHPLLLHESSL